MFGQRMYESKPKAIVCSRKTFPGSFFRVGLSNALGLQADITIYLRLEMSWNKKRGKREA